MKRCPRCGEVKPAGDFHRNRSRRDGLDSCCRACQREYYAANRDKISAQHAVYRASVMRACAVDGCDAIARSNTNGALCQTHYSRLCRTGDVGPATRLDMTGEANPRWRADEIRYRTAHDRVRKMRGRASEYLCVDCTGPAQEWSYQGGCPRERTEFRTSRSGDSRMVAYSPDPDRYVARCIPCHIRFDRAARAAEAT